MKSSARTFEWLMAFAGYILRCGRPMQSESASSAISISGTAAVIRCGFTPGVGIWEIFIPELREETVYKFEIKWRRFGFITQKTDPYAFYFERRPKTGSIVYDINKYHVAR